MSYKRIGQGMKNSWIMKYWLFWEIWRILVEGFMSDSDLSDDQPLISENFNVSEECEDCEECVDEDKELLVVTEDDLYVLELFESLSEELA